MTKLERLQQWYAAQCDGEREHDHGIRIESCDNPGWWVKIDLSGTQLVNQTFLEIHENVDENLFQLSTRWLCCRIEGDVWHGSGDETRLEEILATFLDWAES